MAKFDCSKLVVPHWDSYRNVYVSAFLKRDERNAYYLEKFPGYEFVGKDEEKKEDVYYMVNKEDETAMAVCTGNARYGQFPYQVHSFYENNNIRYKVVLSYVVQRDRDITVYLTENIQDVYVDRFPAIDNDGELETRRDYHLCRFVFEDWNMKKSDFLEIKGASLYSANHKHLICFSSKEYRDVTDDMLYFKDVEDVYPGALRDLDRELCMPQIKKFDELSFGNRGEYFHYQLTFGDKLEKLILRFAKLINKYDSKNAPLLIDRDSDQVKIDYFGHPEYNADEAGHIVFAAPEPNLENPCGKIVAFTLAGSNVKGGVLSGRLRGDGDKWKKTIYIHADDVAAINECECTCFQKHNGTEILLTGPCYCSIEHCNRPQYEHSILPIYVYENVNEVRTKLNKATWNERKFPVIK